MSIPLGAISLYSVSSSCRRRAERAFRPGYGACERAATLFGWFAGPRLTGGVATLNHRLRLWMPSASHRSSLNSRTASRRLCSLNVDSAWSNFVIFGLIFMQTPSGTRIPSWYGACERAATPVRVVRWSAADRWCRCAQRTGYGSGMPSASHRSSFHSRTASRRLCSLNVDSAWSNFVIFSLIFMQTPSGTRIPSWVWRLRAGLPPCSGGSLVRG